MVPAVTPSQTIAKINDPGWLYTSKTSWGQPDPARSLRLTNSDPPVMPTLTSLPDALTRPVSSRTASYTSGTGSSSVANSSDTDGTDDSTPVGPGPPPRSPTRADFLTGEAPTNTTAGFFTRADPTTTPVSGTESSRPDKNKGTAKLGEKGEKDDGSPLEKYDIFVSGKEIHPIYGRRNNPGAPRPQDTPIFHPLSKLSTSSMPADATTGEKKKKESDSPSERFDISISGTEIHPVHGRRNTRPLVDEDASVPKGKPSKTSDYDPVVDGKTATGSKNAESLSVRTIRDLMPLGYQIPASAIARALPRPRNRVLLIPDVGESGLVGPPKALESRGTADSKVKVSLTINPPVPEGHFIPERPNVTEGSIGAAGSNVPQGLTVSEGSKGGKVSKTVRFDADIVKGESVKTQTSGTPKPVLKRPSVTDNAQELPYPAGLSGTRGTPGGAPTPTNLRARQTFGTIPTPNVPGLGTPTSGIFGKFDGSTHGNDDVPATPGLPPGAPIPSIFDDFRWYPAPWAWAPAMWYMNWVLLANYYWLIITFLGYLGYNVTLEGLLNMPLVNRRPNSWFARFLDLDLDMLDWSFLRLIRVYFSIWIMARYFFGYSAPQAQFNFGLLALVICVH